jgi:hypothetical protein
MVLLAAVGQLLAKQPRDGALHYGLAIRRICVVIALGFSNRPDSSNMPLAHDTTIAWGSGRWIKITGRSPTKSYRFFHFIDPARSAEALHFRLFGNL